MVELLLSIATAATHSATLVFGLIWIRRAGWSWPGAAVVGAVAVLGLKAALDLAATPETGAGPGVVQQGLGFIVALALALTVAGLWRRHRLAGRTIGPSGVLGHSLSLQASDRPTAVCRLQPDGRLLYASDSFLETIGRPRDQAIGACLFDIVSKFEAKIIKRHLSEVTPELPTLTSEESLLHEDGSTRRYSYSTAATFDAEGTLSELEISRSETTGGVCTLDELASSQDQLNRAQALTNTGNFERDLQHGYTYWSDELYRIYEFDPAAGLPSVAAAFERIAPEDRSEIQDLVAAAEHTGQPYSFSYRLAFPDGRTKHLRARAELVSDRDGRPAKILGTVQDMTSETEIESRFRDSEKRYQAVVEDQTELICRFRPDTTLTFANRAYAEYFGHSPESLIGTRFIDLIPESDHPGVFAHLDLLGPNNTYLQYEHRVVDKNGTVRWQQWADRVFLDDKGQVVELQSVGRDITALKLAEETLRDHESLLRQAQTVAGLGCWVWDHNNKEVYQSDEIAKMLGVPQGSVAGLPDDDYVARFIAQEDQARVLTAYQSFRETHAPLSIEYRIIRPDGQRFALRERLEEVVNEDGGPPRVIGTLQDISKEKKAQRALLEAHAAAEEASAAKTRFLAAASHDLRQPLHALRLLTECISRAQSAENRDSIVGEIKTALETMGGMLNALLDISELDSGTVQADHDDVEVDALLDHVLVTAAPLAERKDLVLRRVPCDAVVHSDPSLLARILDNFLSNAVRYTESGRILVGCRRDGDALWIEVWDTGVGIPNKDLGRIFEEYYQLSNASRDRSKGLGLGLSIVDRIAGILGHEVKARSVPGRGSVFSVRVPLGEGRRDAPDVDDRLSHGEWTMKTVLVVDDDPMVLEATCHLLRQWNLTVFGAANRNDAFASIAGDAKVPDFIVADYRLPKGDSGLQVIHDIRRAAGREIPAVVVTGDTSAAISTTAEEAQCNTLHKPIDPSHLHRVMSAQFGG